MVSRQGAEMTTRKRQVAAKPSPRGFSQIGGWLEKVCGQPARGGKDREGLGQVESRLFPDPDAGLKEIHMPASM
ncbi:hypothetical protein GGTG_02855 [Gaeumannomyces tritici R3-111a-1]|uniref:Uncharacterized protein n=1 Tax=Gaeumannomyces tritici (strain R3-111a-1) TaxID=644352 RepID=J3NNJ8_GAET3|nr:hypothetical protein GGTG_02855 [Gaeumannomyces tritici R3-111a-1]EJT77750.1 hypothetical protein GGTG_02855 [Gaeumannomyces tritici R3-111a-1]